MEISTSNLWEMDFRGVKLTFLYLKAFKSILNYFNWLKSILFKIPCNLRKVNLEILPFFTHFCWENLHYKQNFVAKYLATIIETSRFVFKNFLLQGSIQFLKQKASKVLFKSVDSRFLGWNINIFVKPILTHPLNVAQKFKMFQSTSFHQLPSSNLFSTVLLLQESSLRNNQILMTSNTRHLILVPILERFSKKIAKSHQQTKKKKY